MTASTALRPRQPEGEHDHEPPTLGILSGFVGPIQGLARFDSCGINQSGVSSSGKTLSQRLAVSVWSSTGLGSGLLQSLRTTENAVESIAQSAMAPSPVTRTP
jgi:Domain of unknown function (DUF927)